MSDPRADLRGPAAARGAAAFVAAAAVIAVTLGAAAGLYSCATPAASPPSAVGGTAATLATPAAPGGQASRTGDSSAGEKAPVAAPIGPAAAPKVAPKPRDIYLEAALADYLREQLPNGACLAIKRQAGRKIAVARIVLARDGSIPDPREAGYEALGLAVASEAAAASAVGLESAAFNAGATISLRLEDYDDMALELVCPTESLADLLSLAARNLASPAFAQPDFDRALREARIAERRESGDPLLRAETELRAELFKGHPYSLPPRGTVASLAAATRDGLARYWSSRFSPGRLSVVVVADLEPSALAKVLEPVFGAVPRGCAGAAVAAGAAAIAGHSIPIRPWFKAIALTATPGSAVLHGEYSAPDSRAPDFPALSVALLMLDDLLAKSLRGERSLAYGAWTRLSAAAAPTASVTVYKTPDPAAAKAAVDAAIATLASGSCLDAYAEVGPIERNLAAYKALAITGAYSRVASSEGMAARIARDLAAGGDGTAIFRLAGRIRDVRAQDVARVARERLLEGPAAWIALGDPALVSGLPASAFVSNAGSSL